MIHRKQTNKQTNDCTCLQIKPYAKIVSVDISEAQKSPGFVAYFDASKVPGSNNIGEVIHDEELFMSKLVTEVGQPIGLVVAETEVQAIRAADKVTVKYGVWHEDLC